ncbi:monothiol glutaredoxin grx5 [Microbotryomycetes sp. JL221]|nr:monothiol glutaredoxin grx5 [Microbotryomycetes sp. JL221]
MLLRTANSLLNTPTRLATNVCSSRLATRFIVRHLSAEARQKIDNVVKSNDLVLFMKGTPEMPQCGFSRAVCQVFQVNGVPLSKLKTFNCLQDEELRQSIKEYSQWPTIPQVYLKGEFLGGCDIMVQMHQSGELEQLLIDAKLIEPVTTTDQAQDDAKA